MATNNYTAQTSIDSEFPSMEASKTTPVPTRRSPRPWGLASARVCIHALVIAFAIPCIVMSLVPLRDLQDEYIGETYWRYLVMIAGLAVAPFLCLCLSVTEIATYMVRSAKRGIHPFWFLGLCIVCMLGEWTVAIMHSVWVGVKIDDKSNEWINHLGDACQDREKFWDGDVTCYDGWYGREGLFIALMVLSFALAIVESTLCCFLSCSDVRVRKQERRAQVTA